MSVRLDCTHCPGTRTLSRGFFMGQPLLPIHFLSILTLIVSVVWNRWLLTAFSFSVGNLSHIFSVYLPIHSMCSNICCQGYRILINLNRLAEKTNGSQNRTSNIHRTDTHIQFSTQIFNSQRQTYAQEESYELSPLSSRGREDSRTGRRTFETSQISTLSLGKWNAELSFHDSSFVLQLFKQSFIRCHQN